MTSIVSDFLELCAILNYIGGKKQSAKLTRKPFNGCTKQMLLVNRLIAGTALSNGSKKITVFTGSAAKLGLENRL